MNHYLAMIDLDHFKLLNDTYGHVAGDHILTKVADVFKQYESDNVKIGRYGGEEFCMLKSKRALRKRFRLLRLSGEKSTLHGLRLIMRLLRV